MYRPVPAQLTQGCVVSPVFFDVVGAELEAVVLNPTCDFQQSNLEAVTLIALFPLTMQIERLLESAWARFRYETVTQNGVAIRNRRNTLSSGKAREFLSEIKDLRHNKKPRFHWFEPIEDAGEPLIADFQIINSIHREDADNCEILAYLSSEYLEQLPARYVSYMGRIGVPDPAADVHVQHAERMIAHFFPGDSDT